MKYIYLNTLLCLQVEVARALLKRNTAAINGKEKRMGRTPIHFACSLVCNKDGLVQTNCLMPGEENEDIYEKHVRHKRTSKVEPQEDITNGGVLTGHNNDDYSNGDALTNGNSEEVHDNDHDTITTKMNHVHIEELDLPKSARGASRPKSGHKSKTRPKSGHLTDRSIDHVERVNQPYDDTSRSISSSQSSRSNKNSKNGISKNGLLPRSSLHSTNGANGLSRSNLHSINGGNLTSRTPRPKSSLIIPPRNQARHSISGDHQLLVNSPRRDKYKSGGYLSTGRHTDRPQTAPARRQSSTMPVLHYMAGQSTSRTSESGSHTHRGHGAVFVTPHNVHIIRHRLVSLLIDHGADPNLMTAFRKSPLHITSILADSDLVHTLLPHITNVNMLSSNNKTALHFAVENDCLPIVEQLVNAGANLALRDIKGKMLLNFLFLNCRFIN